jgi:hypothetical protein
MTVAFPSEVRHVGAPTCKGGKDSWSNRGQYSVTLCDDWKSTVLDEGLANIDGRFVMEARADWRAIRAEIENLQYEVPYVERVWYGTWIEKGRGYELKAIGGLIVKLDTGESFVVSMDDITVSYEAAFRKAAKEARKRRYQAAKIARAS